MFLTFEEKKCPICGTMGKESTIKELSHCPNCGAKFNEFGIILIPQKPHHLHWS